MMAPLRTSGDKRPSEFIGFSAETFVMKGGDDWEAEDCKRWRSIQLPSIERRKLWKEELSII